MSDHEKQDEQQVMLQRQLGAIKHKIIVLSCKGGVGKSTVAVNLAASLSRAGQQVGLLDVDVHGPSIPKLLNIDGDQVVSRKGRIFPAGFEGLEVMSIGFMLHSKDDAVIWRGPRKMKMIRQFLADVEWGPLDYLIVDCPPGTGDEPLAVAQLIEDATGAVIVTTPQDLAILDVRKSISFCKTMKVNVLGVIENMSGFTCPNCGEVVDIFSSGGGEAMAEDMGVPFLGRIPLDPDISRSGDEGIPLSFVGAKSEASRAFAQVVERILEQIGETDAATAALSSAIGSGE